MIGQALEGMGRLVDAAETYEHLVAEPLPVGSPEAFRLAQRLGKERLRSPRARVPALLVTVSGPAAYDAKATLNGKPFDLQARAAVRLTATECADRRGAPLVRRRAL